MSTSPRPGALRAAPDNVPRAAVPPGRRLAGTAAFCLCVLLGALARGGPPGDGPAAAPPAAPGAVVAVGGGGTTAAILARTLELAGGPRARVVVLAQASLREDAGEGSAEMWRAAGAASARAIELGDPSAAAQAIRAADLVWMPGGSQSRLLAALSEAGLVEVIRERHAAGAVVGGTSAGAAVLSELMLTGKAELGRVAAGTTELVPGLGVWEGAILDQHALARQRLNRSLSAVLDRPSLVGVAVDERTAAILCGTAIEVVGDRNVVVIDARAADVPRAEPGAPAAGTGLALHVLSDGMRLELAREERRSGSGS